LLAIFALLVIVLWPTYVLLRAYTLLHMVRRRAFAKASSSVVDQSNSLVTSTTNPIGYWSGIGLYLFALAMLSVVYVYYLPALVRFLEMSLR
jgi:hypothetical protein